MSLLPLLSSRLTGALSGRRQSSPAASFVQERRFPIILVPFPIPVQELRWDIARSGSSGLVSPFEGTSKDGPFCDHKPLTQVWALDAFWDCLCPKRELETGTELVYLAKT